MPHLVDECHPRPDVCIFNGGFASANILCKLTCKMQAAWCEQCRRSLHVPCMLIRSWSQSFHSQLLVHQRLLWFVILLPLASLHLLLRRHVSFGLMLKLRYLSSSLMYDSLSSTNASCAVHTQQVQLGTQAHVVELEKLHHQRNLRSLIITDRTLACNPSPNNYLDRSLASFLAGTPSLLAPCPINRELLPSVSSQVE